MRIMGYGVLTGYGVPIMDYRILGWNLPHDTTGVPEGARLRAEG